MFPLCQVVLVRVSSAGGSNDSRKRVAGAKRSRPVTEGGGVPMYFFVGSVVCLTSASCGLINGLVSDFDNRTIAV